MRRRMQMIFQDPMASLNPRRRIGDIVAEPLLIAGVKDPEARAAHPRGADRRRPRPTWWSGAVPARIFRRPMPAHRHRPRLDPQPELIVCDEPVSSLDVSIRAQILNLLEEMKARFGLTLLFIAHDLAVVKAVSDRVAVMYLGKLCEIAATEQLFRSPGASLYRVADRGDPWARSGCSPARAHSRG